jgi:hypothetical protein
LSVCSTTIASSTVGMRMKLGHATWRNLFAGAQLRQYLCFIGTELHKGLYVSVARALAEESALYYH